MANAQNIRRHLAASLTVEKVEEVAEQMREEILSSLLPWASENLRSYPWRKSQSPYEILVAEILLKRTTAKAAARVYEIFLQKYPNLKALSRTKPEELELILKPIGYNKLRSSELKAISAFIIRNYAGQIPQDFGKLLDVPFIGPYTAGAIMCFAFGSCAPMVDSNVERIVFRLFNHLFEKKPGNEEVTDIISKIIPPDHYKQFNLGMLDLGALLCSPREPKCRQCPLRNVCDYGALIEK